MTIRNIVASLRPTQWTKNVFVAAALIFAKKIFDVPLLLRTLAAIGVFCILSGSHYLFNDVLDIEEDKIHPRKSGRPVAAGLIRPVQALFLAGVLGAASLVLALLLNTGFFFAAATYLVLQIAYSIKLKHVVLLDIFLIASGFVLRVVAGGLVIRVPVSHWLLLCTMLGALFLAIIKRRHELLTLSDMAAAHRPILSEYSFRFLDQMASVVASSAILAYCLYTLSEETIRKIGSDRLIYTTPFVVYGIFRYLYLVHQKNLGGNPEDLLFRDGPLFVSIVLWVAASVVIIYVH